MISLRQSIKDLDGAEALHRAAAKAFAEAVETSAEHIVELNRHDAVAFREQVLGLAGRVGQSTGAEDLSAARTTFRGELRQYSEKASQDVSRLREELTAAAAAMQTFAQGVSASSGEHETVLRREFRELERAATDASDLQTVRAAVHETVQTVSSSYETLKQAHNLAIAELRDEIRVLQNEVQRGRQKPVLPDGVREKQVFDSEIEDLLLQKKPFAVVLLAVRNERVLYEKFPREKVDTALVEFLEGLRALAQRHAPKALIATWNRGVYALAMPRGVQLEEWRRQLSVSYVFQEKGLPRTLQIEPRLEMVEHRLGESPTQFFGRLSQAAAIVTQTQA